MVLMLNHLLEEHNEQDSCLYVAYGDVPLLKRFYRWL